MRSVRVVLVLGAVASAIAAGRLWAEAFGPVKAPAPTSVQPLRLFAAPPALAPTPSVATAIPSHIRHSAAKHESLPTRHTPTPSFANLAVPARAHPGGSRSAAVPTGGTGAKPRPHQPSPGTSSAPPAVAAPKPNPPKGHSGSGAPEASAAPVSPTKVVSETDSSPIVTAPPASVPSTPSSSPSPSSTPSSPPPQSTGAGAGTTPTASQPQQVQPGWGYGDPNHEHSGPPGQQNSGPPGQQNSGPPGQQNSGPPVPHSGEPPGQAGNHGH